MKSYLLFQLLCFIGVAFCDLCKAPITTSETEVNGEIFQFKWLEGGNPNYTNVYAHTFNTQVYLSSDEGKSWANQSPYLTNFSYVHTINGQKRSGVVDMEPSPADSNTVYFLGWEGFLWTTRTGGRNGQYSYYRTNPNWRTILLHPTKPGYLLGLGLTQRCIQRNVAGDCYTELYLSKDYGATWTLIETYVYQFTWANAGMDGVPEDSVWVLDYPEKRGPQTSKPRSSLELRHSTDYFATSQTHLDGVVFMLHWRSNTFIARTSSLGGFELWVSEDNGGSFNQAVFPFQGTLQENGYVILDDSEGSCFVHVTHDSLAYGNLYSSDKLGDVYDLVLEYQSRNFAQPDFIKMMSLDGIFLANQADVTEEGPVSGKSSMITFNLGGDWQRLALPEDLQGNPVDCPDSACQLNLHTIYKRPPSASQPARTAFGPLYSNENAVGLIIGTGNVGDNLGQDLSEANTYLSRDGGWNWREIHQGSRLYEFADHGGIILTADNIQDTRSIAYTTDEGLTFNECDFTTGSPVDITNIIARPTYKGQSFILHGKRQNSTGQTTGYLIHVDMNGIFPRSCNQNDYEKWCPTDDITSGATCLLGQAKCFDRRKQNANCLNSEAHEVVVSTTTCLCSTNDFECDECWIKSGLKGGCEPDPSCPNPTKKPEPCVGTYMAASGYRLNAATQCDINGGVDLSKPKETACEEVTSGTTSDDDDNNGDSSNVGAIIGIVFAVLCVLVTVIGAVFYFRQNPEKWRSIVGAIQGGTEKLNARDYETEGTALDPDLLEEREAQPIDDTEIESSFKD